MNIHIDRQKSEAGAITGLIFWGKGYAATQALPFRISGRVFSFSTETLQMIVNENNPQPYMKSLVTCLNKVVEEGYTEDFTVTEEGLHSAAHDRIYTPAEVEVVNFFRFEGTSNPDDEAVLYVMETIDGVKGTLTDAYGIYMSGDVSAFMRDVEQFHKKKTNESS
ncbi:MAG: hypothetical protein JWP27_185 [Flaviaesturariibacter sp.]|nr:hypothetical protein [Flaviaesturariibacter sp.]